MPRPYLTTARPSLITSSALTTCVAAAGVDCRGLTQAEARGHLPQSNGYPDGGASTTAPVAAASRLRLRLGRMRPTRPRVGARHAVPLSAICPPVSHHVVRSSPTRVAVAGVDCRGLTQAEACVFASAAANPLGPWHRQGIVRELG